MSFALRLAGHGDGVELITQWEDPSPTSEKDILENILLKKQIGVSTDQLLRETGYGEVDVRRMMKGLAVEEDLRSILKKDPTKDPGDQKIHR